MKNPRQFGALAVIVLLLAGCGGGTVPNPVTPKPTAYDLANIEASVAYIQTQGTFVTADGTAEAAYSGSGFVVDSAGGFIVTNTHVVTGGAFWKVAIGASSTLLDAQVIGVSECSDIAVLKVAGKYPALTMASANPSVGETIYVAGHPNGDPYTLTNGIVAKPAAPADTSWASVENEVQITAQTYPGNSGSPVVDANGQVVAVEYAGGVPGSDIAGESFAIGASEAKGVVDQIIKTGGNLDYIGINGQADSDNGGIFIMSVAPGSPADKAGILPGDLLTDLNGTAVGLDGTKATYCSVLRSHKSADTLSVKILRGTQILSGEINGRALAVTGSTATPMPVATDTPAPVYNGQVLFGIVNPSTYTACAPALTVTSVSAKTPVYVTFIFDSRAGSEKFTYTITKNGAAFGNGTMTKTSGYDCIGESNDLSKLTGWGPGLYEFTEYRNGVIIGIGDLTVQ